MKKRKSMSLKEALAVGTAVFFDGLPCALDSISLSEAKDALSKATNRHPTSVTLKMAHEVVRVEYLRQRDQDRYRDANNPLVIGDEIEHQVDKPSRSFSV